jgi:DNA helicase-2/ATP-dependent DNA helicase PcrA
VKKRVRKIKVSLNESQQKVVDWGKGALLVSAGPGSGKTRVVVERIARMIKDGVDPNAILATTFTRKAADEMNERLQEKGIDTRRMAVQTMHAFCYRILRRHKKFKDWEVDDKDLARLVLKEILGFRRMDWKVDITTVESFISLSRNYLVTPMESYEKSKDVFDDIRFSEAYKLYHLEIINRKLLTFDDMLYFGVKLLTDEPSLLQHIQRRYKYVMVDEFQDSNVAQIELAELVSQPEDNLMVVGDIDQAIYSWRGAVPTYMLDFIDKHESEVIELGVNYRCAPGIMKAAATCIENNEERITKNLTAFRSIDAKITVEKTLNSEDEAVEICEQIKVLHESGVKYKEIFILMRANAQSRSIEEQLIRNKIPFIVLGSIGFYQRKEVKDILSYLRLLVNPNDIESGERAINRPFRYISKQILDEISSNCSNLTYIESTREITRTINNNAVLQKINSFLNLIYSLSVENNPAFTITKILEETDYIQYLIESEGSDNPETSRENNITELVNAASKFENTLEFLNHVDEQIRLRRHLNKRRNVNKDCVLVMTIHKAKGMEANTVFLIGTNEGIFPHPKAELEEERRLFYVAITRAKDNLFISCPQYQGNSPLEASRFISETKILTEDEYRYKVDSLSTGAHEDFDSLSHRPVEPIHR